MDPSGRRIAFATFVGGKAEDTAQSIAIDSKGQILIAGVTCSGDFPATEGAIDGGTLLFATAVGHSADEMVTGLATDNKDNVYLTGRDMTLQYFLDDDRVVVGGITNSADFPLTADALDSAYPAADKLFNSSFLGRRKAFVSVVDIRKGLVAETGPHGFPGMTDSPLSEDALAGPPTNLMLGRLVLSGAHAQRQTWGTRRNDYLPCP